MELLQVDIQSSGYPDRAQVVRNIAFSVHSGELVGLIGPNGAGKSTTIKTVLGLLKNVEGQVVFSGERKHYAYIPEQPILYTELTLWEHLELAAAAYEIEQKLFEERANRLLEKFRLTQVKHQLPTSFSKGMQQKIMLILGFLIEPDIYVVDEPFIGLDPRATKDFLDMLDEERRRGAGVLMSTHVLDTAERICDRFLLLSEGSLMASGTFTEIREQSGLQEGTLFDCFNWLM